MADAIIEIVGQEDLPVIVEMYNQVYRPARDVESFQRRFQGRHNILQMIARVGDRPVGFFLNFELKPTTFFAWFYGVIPKYRLPGISSQSMHADPEWARQYYSNSSRPECQHSP